MYTSQYETKLLSLYIYIYRPIFFSISNDEILSPPQSNSNLPEIKWKRMNDTVWNHSGAPYHRLEPAMAFLEINAQTPRNRPPHNNPEIINNNIQFQLNPEQESNNSPQREKSAAAWTRRKKVCQRSLCERSRWWSSGKSLGPRGLLPLQFQVRTLWLLI